MKIISITAAVAACAALSACGANSKAQLEALKAVVTDTNCSHDDKLAIVSGAAGIASSFTASAERHCPVGGAQKPVTPVVVGAVVAPTTNP